MPLVILSLPLIGSRGALINRYIPWPPAQDNFERCYRWCGWGGCWCGLGAYQLKGGGNEPAAKSMNAVLD
jgi:hypothetical protein